MVVVLLVKALLRALSPRAALLLAGDVDQLPSVGPGQVLVDVIGSGAVPVMRLTEVFRQAATSRVIVNAHRINAGQMPEAIRRSQAPFRRAMACRRLRGLTVGSVCSKFEFRGTFPRLG